MSPTIGVAAIKLPVTKSRTLDVVMADDDEDEQYFFSIALQEVAIPVKVKFVSDGEELINYLLQSLSCIPDVIFLDIMMPRKDGFECLKEIKGNERLAHIPIIMYSNSVADDFIRRAYEYKATYFLQKGNYSELPESLGRLLSLIANNTGQAIMEDFKVSFKRFALL